MSDGREGTEVVVELVTDAVTSRTNRNNPTAPESKCLAALRERCSCSHRTSISCNIITVEPVDRWKCSLLHAAMHVIHLIISPDFAPEFAPECCQNFHHNSQHSLHNSRLGKRQKKVENTKNLKKNKKRPQITEMLIHRTNIIT